jgi:hypothetical protein
MPSVKRKPIALATSRLSVLVSLLLAVGAAAPAAAQTSDLVSKTAFRVCADPANMPMSDKSGAGFENKIAELLAAELKLPLEYTWFPMATGFIRKTLQAYNCDVVIGYAQGDEMVLNTNHYYTSGFVLIVPTDGPLAGVTAIGDPAQDKRVGVVAGSPPEHMALHGLRPGQGPTDGGPTYRIGRDMLADLKPASSMRRSFGGRWRSPGQEPPGFQGDAALAEPLPPLFYRITMGVRRRKVWERKFNSLIRRTRRNQPDLDGGGRATAERHGHGPAGAAK